MLLPLETLLEHHPEAASVRKRLKYLGETLPTSSFLGPIFPEPPYQLSTKVTDLSHQIIEGRRPPSGSVLVTSTLEELPSNLGERLFDPVKEQSRSDDASHQLRLKVQDLEEAMKISEEMKKLSGQEWEIIRQHYLYGESSYRVGDSFQKMDYKMEERLPRVGLYLPGNEFWYKIICLSKIKLQTVLNFDLPYLHANLLQQQAKRIEFLAKALRKGFSL
ncbi:MAG: hypothetical protein HEQ32_02635 [Vampirovibrio sp.]